MFNYGNVLKELKFFFKIEFYQVDQNFVMWFNFVPLSQNKELTQSG